MKKITLTSFSILSICALALGQESKKEQDIHAIKSMCGCYEIEFKYQETFSPNRDYERHDGYRALATEWVELVEDSNKKLVLQHLLVIKDTMVIKHWRQDWEYENQKVFYYDKDNNWVFKTVPKEEVKGQWTQKVFQVDDSPRYSGSATWIHADGKHYWENEALSPLPRREYTKRDDYNVMLRGNRHELTKTGWIHEQDNDKILKKDGKNNVLVAQEKGYNIYTKVADLKCLAAQKWWKENEKFWARVRSSWDKVYNRQGDLTLSKSVDRKPLFMYFADLEAANAKKREISDTIEKFVSDKSMATNQYK